MSPDGSRKSRYTTHATLGSLRFQSVFKTVFFKECLYVHNWVTLLCKKRLAPHCKSTTLQQKIKTLLLFHVFIQITSLFCLTGSSAVRLILKVHICSNTSDIFGNNLRITGILCCSCAILSMSDTQKTTTDWTDTHLCLMSASYLSSSWARCMSSHKHWMLLQQPVLFQHTSQWLWGCNSSDCPLPPANFRSFPKQSALFLNH